VYNHHCVAHAHDTRYRCAHNVYNHHCVAHAHDTRYRCVLATDNDTVPQRYFGIAALACAAGAVILYAHMSTGGNIWTTLFGRSVVTWLWGTLVTRLHVVVSLVVQVAVVIGVAVAVHRFALLDEKKSMWLACGLIVAVLAAECAFHARSPIDATVMKAAQEPDERCKPTINGTYPVLSLPEEKHRSSVRSPVNPVCEQRRGCEKCCVLRALVCLCVCLSSVNANNPPAQC
jgi:hypothetical protein